MDEFYITRHGETDFNKLGLLCGISDVSLNGNGFEQAYNLGYLICKKILNNGIDAIVTSPLLRARQTSYIVNSALNLPIVQIEEFRETNCGEYEGQVLDPSIWQRWSIGEKIGENVETFEHCKYRVNLGLQKIQRYKKPLIIAHGGTLFSICSLLSIKNLKDLHFSNCVLYLIQKQNNEWFAIEIT